MPMNLPRILRQHQCPASAEAVRELVLATYLADYPDRTVEELILDSPEAIRFCDRVRERLNWCLLPCSVLNGILQNLRKAGRLAEHPGYRRRRAASPPPDFLPLLDAADDDGPDETTGGMAHAG